MLYSLHQKCLHLLRPVKRPLSLQLRNQRGYNHLRQRQQTYFSTVSLLHCLDQKRKLLLPYIPTTVQSKILLYFSSVISCVECLCIVANPIKIAMEHFYNIAFSTCLFIFICIYAKILVSLSWRLLFSFRLASTTRLPLFSLSIIVLCHKNTNFRIRT